MQPDKRTRFERRLGLLAAIILVIGCFMIMRPFISALLWAVVLCYCTWPLYARALKLTGGRRALAALLVTLGMILIVLVPLVIIAATMADNVHALTIAMMQWFDAGPPQPPEWLGKIPLLGHRAIDYWLALVNDSSKLLVAAKRLVEPLSALFLVVGKALVGGLLELTLSVLIAFFLFRSGETIGRRANAMVDRISGGHGGHLLLLAGQTVRGVVYGILGTALVQALMAGIGFALAGVPGAGILALLTFFLSVVPVGPPLIWIPAAIWLFHQGANGWGIFMIVWGLGVSSIDNVVKPWLISQGSDMPFLLIFFGVLGGALAFGFIGVFLGPTLLAVAYKLFSEWTAAQAPAAETKSEPAGSAG